MKHSTVRYFWDTRGSIIGFFLCGFVWRHSAGAFPVSVFTLISAERRPRPQRAKTQRNGQKRISGELWIAPDLEWTGPTKLKFNFWFYVQKNRVLRYGGQRLPGVKIKHWALISFCRAGIRLRRSHEEWFTMETRYITVKITAGPRLTPLFIVWTDICIFKPETLIKEKMRLTIFFFLLLFLLLKATIPQFKMTYFFRKCSCFKSVIKAQ